MKKFTVRLFVLCLIMAFLVFPNEIKSQEVVFFTDGTNNTFYDQGIVDVNNLGASTFEYTHPPGGPQWNDKIPCSSTAYKGSSSLKFNYTSSSLGNWRVNIYRSDWTTVNLTGLDSLSFYVYSLVDFPANALPMIGIKANRISGSGDLSSRIYNLSEFNNSIKAGKWTRVTFPLSRIFNDPENSQMNFASAKSVIFNQSESNNQPRLILIDEIKAFKSVAKVDPVEALTATGYDSHVELKWKQAGFGLTYRVYATFDNGITYENRGETTENYYLDFVPEKGKNKQVKYRVVSVIQGKESIPVEANANLRDYTDDELLDMYQRYSFRYFWEGAHQESGMALERTNGNGRTVASGATGMGLMAMIVAHERNYVPKEEIKDRILKILYFLENCTRFHGAWAHWYNGDTYQAQPFSTKDNGGDLVETSFVAQALIALKNYFDGSDSKSIQIVAKANKLWREIEWTWYQQNNQNVLYWHWSPNYNFEMNMKVTGWNECLITYVMAASSPTYSIPKAVYDQGWARNGTMVRKRNYYNYEINLMPDWGGPLFWLHYSHLGIDPRGLKDQYADYWKEFVNTALIHHAYSVANPMGHKNYSEKNWGLTASDDPYGYTAHKPMSNDNGTISPTAALASMPYSPEQTLKAAKYFYRERGKDLFGIYGPYDAFNDNLNWVKKAYLGIDQGPIVVMIENYRTGLLWKNVMKDSDVINGLNKLGFQYRISSSNSISDSKLNLKVYPNPASSNLTIVIPENITRGIITIELYDSKGSKILEKELSIFESSTSLDMSGIRNGMYNLRLNTAKGIYNTSFIKN